MTKQLWLRFAARRLASLAGVLAALVVGTFLIVQLIPGDPARLLAGSGATEERIVQLRGELGLDQPLLNQFWGYLSSLLQGDLGNSFATGEPVMKVIGDRLPFTAQLAFIAIVFVLVVAVPLGMWVAVACRGGRKRWLDNGFTFATALAGAVPEYVLGSWLVIVLAVQLGLFPAAGAATVGALVLPVLAISVGPISSLARIVRRETAVVLEQDYLRTARGRRIGAWRLYTRHALPNLLTSTLTLGGLILANLLGGAVIAEIVFNWPGIGSRAVGAIISRDFPVIQGLVLVLGLIATAVNMLIDVVLGVVDPRTLAASSSPEAKS
jgi:peptide/nickel transport system permease protein